MKEDPVSKPFDLPVFEKSQIEWRPAKVVWEEVMDETEPLRKYYLEHFDNPEKRLRAKNPEVFRMD